MTTTARNHTPVVQIPSAHNGAWWRHVTSTDNSQRGAYCLLSESGPFLGSGEHEMATGSVLVEAGTNKTVRIWVVRRSGALVLWTDEPSQNSEWMELSAKITLCKAVDAALAASEREVLRRAEERVAGQVSRCEDRAERMSSRLVASSDPEGSRYRSGLELDVRKARRAVARASAGRAEIREAIDALGDDPEPEAIERELAAARANVERLELMLREARS